MSTKKQTELNYKHYMTPDKILLGVDKSLTEEEASMFLDTPLKTYNKNIDKIFQLDPREREIVISSLDEWIKTKKSEATFSGLYWDILLDFILYVFDRNIHSLAIKMDEIQICKGDDEVYFCNSKVIADTIYKMRNNKSGALSKNYQRVVTMICYYCGITPDILKTGVGTLYQVTDTDKYTITAIDEYYKSHKVIDLKDMIASITGIDKEEVKEMPLQIAVEETVIDTDIYNFIEILIDKMIESRD